MKAHHTTRTVIGVHPADEFDCWRFLWEALRDIFPVEFVPGCRTSSEGVIVFAGSDQAGTFFERGISCFCVTDKPITGSGTLVFSSHAEVPLGFRGARLTDPSLCEFSPVAPIPGGTVQAIMDGQPLWVRRRRDKCIFDVVGVAPTFDGTGSLRDHFCASSWFSLLPLLDFLRAVSGARAHLEAPLRATFMFDDPNLHSRRYGYLDFSVLAKHARDHNYHVAIATIPIDAWYANSSAIKVFRENPAQLSLLVHGNNHVRAELAIQGTQEQKIRLLAQALRRVQSLERRTELSVSRVMAAPHGACTESTLLCMKILGFEAACISDGSLTKWNSQRKWGLSFGFQPAEFFHGFPVIPRISVTSDLAVRLTVFLHRPLVVMAHHSDCSAGLDRLAELADLINSFGPVTWSNMQSMARSNFLANKTGDHLAVTTFARRVRLRLDRDVRTLEIQPAWMEERPLLVCQSASGPLLYKGPPNCVIHTEDNGGTELDITFRVLQPMDPAHVPAPKPTLWPILRRVLCEGRDRSQPLLAAIVRPLS